MVIEAFYRRYLEGQDIIQVLDLDLGLDMDQAQPKAQPKDLAMAEGAAMAWAQTSA
jgi:hypothetical protein